MTLFRIFLALMLLLLVGCATTGKYGEDLGFSLCNGAMQMHHSVGKNVDIGELFYDYDENASKSFSGIQSARINGAELILPLIEKSQYEQYSAPKVGVLNLSKYEAHPIEGLLYTVFSLGMYPVFMPSEFVHYTFGCTEKTISFSEPLRKVKTGKVEWRDAHTGHKLLVSGFDRDYEFTDFQVEILEYSSRHLFLIDLTKAILATNLTESTNLKITCMDCDLLGPEEQKLYKDAKKTVELTYDFRSVKKLLIKAVKEKAIQRELQEKENKKVEKERNGAPINRFKEQCMQLGFKAGTQDFGNCVLELNDAK